MCGVVCHRAVWLVLSCLNWSGVSRYVNFAICWENITLYYRARIVTACHFVPKILSMKEWIHFLDPSVYKTCGIWYGVAFLDSGYKHLCDSSMSKSPILDCVRDKGKSNAGGSVDTGRSNAEDPAKNFPGNFENRSVRRSKANANYESWYSYKITKLLILWAAKDETQTKWRAREHFVVIWFMTPCSSVGVYRHFGGTCCFHLQGV
jgi:hypothetical protein